MVTGGTYWPPDYSRRSTASKMPPGNLSLSRTAMRGNVKTGRAARFSINPLQRHRRDAPNRIPILPCESSDIHVGRADVSRVLALRPQNSSIRSISKNTPSCVWELPVLLGLNLTEYHYLSLLAKIEGYLSNCDLQICALRYQPSVFRHGDILTRLDAARFESPGHVLPFLAPEHQDSAFPFVAS